MVIHSSEIGKLRQATRKTCPIELVWALKTRVWGLYMPHPRGEAAAVQEVGCSRDFRLKRL